MKALSPLIAAIILVVITIVTGVIVSNFITQFVTRHTGSQTICATNALYSIESAVFNRSGDDLLVLIIINKGEERLFGFGVELFNATDIETFKANSSQLSVSPEINETNRLGQEESAIIKLNLSGNDLIETADLVKVRNLACVEASAQTRDITKFIRK